MKTQMNYISINNLNNLDDIHIDSSNGDFLYCQRIFSENKSFEFTGREFITSTSDVAFILKNLQGYGIEHSFVCYVLPDRTAVVQHLGMGDFTSCVVNLDIIRYTMIKLNAEGVYLAHNHPSGNLFFGMHDRLMHASCERAMGEIYKGSILINTVTGHYAFIQHDSDKETIDRIANPQLTDVPVQVIEFDKQVFSREFNYNKALKVQGPTDIAIFISTQKFGMRNKAGILILNRSMMIMANIHLPFTKVSEDTCPEIASYIQKCITATGGTDTIMYFSGSISKKMMSLLRTELARISNFKLCDVCYDLDHGLQSALENGLLKDDSMSIRYKGTSIKI